MQSNRESRPLPGPQPAWGICLALGLSLGFLLLARQGTWTLPQLNWDEGTRMSIASSLNHGRTLYVDAWDHHTFLDVLFFQQLFRIFPTDWVPLVLHICNAAIVCALCGLVYLGVARAGAVPVWALGASVVSGYLFSRDWAIAGHGEFYHSLPVALAFYVCFLGPRTRWRMLFAGVLFALGFCIKQTAVFDLAAGLLLILLDAPSHQAGPDRGSFGTAASQIGWILMGTLFIAILCAGYFLAHGALRPALYTTFVDPLVYSTGRDPGETLTKFANAFTNLLGQAADVHWLITGAALVSWAWVVMAGLRRLQGDVVWRLAMGAGVWLVVDLLGLVLIGRFYDHYLIQLIVPASIFCTALLGFVGRAWTWPALLPFFVALWLVPAMRWGLQGRQQFSQLDWAEVHGLVQFVRTTTRPGENIYLYQDSALCTYYLAERFPPTKVFMDHQLLPENKDGPALLAEAMASLERSRPKLIIRGDLGRSVPEIDAFLQDHYTHQTNFGIHQVFTPVPVEAATAKPSCMH